MESGEPLILNRKLELLGELSEPEYRRAFVEGHAKDTIAFQLRMLRKAKEWEQRDVARELGNEKLQPMISRYENPDYGRYSITTLLELASVFDVALVVRFAPFSELLEWDWASTRDTLQPSSFNNDEHLKGIETQIRNDLQLAARAQAAGANVPAAIVGTQSEKRGQLADVQQPAEAHGQGEKFMPLAGAAPAMGLAAAARGAA